MKKMLLGIAAVAVLFTSNVFASAYSDYLENPEKTLRESANLIILNNQQQDPAVKAGHQEAISLLFAQAGVSTSLKLQQSNGINLTLSVSNLSKAFDRYSLHLYNDYTLEDKIFTKYLIFTNRELNSINVDIVNTFPDVEGFNTRVASKFIKAYYESSKSHPLDGFQIVYKTFAFNNHSDIKFVGHNAVDIQDFTLAVSNNNYEAADEILIGAFKQNGVTKDTDILVSKYSLKDDVVKIEQEAKVEANVKIFDELKKYNYIMISNSADDKNTVIETSSLIKKFDAYKKYLKKDSVTLAKYNLFYNEDVKPFNSKDEDVGKLFYNNSSNTYVNLIMYVFKKDYKNADKVLNELF